MPETTDDVVVALHEQATAATGLSEFGSDDYLPALRRLIEGMAASPEAQGEGIGPLTGLAFGPLVGRLKTEEAWRRFPEYRQTEVGAPVVIVGMPRTGTTALHTLLAVDPRYQVSERWVQANPQPRPPRETWEANSEYQQAVARAEMAPEIIKRTHFVLPDEGDECIGPMAQSFVSNLFGSQVAIPDYDEWFLAQDMTPSFRRYADFLRLIGSTAADKVWLLKNPSHVLCLEELFEVFPDAKVIQTHRDPQAALGSVVSLLVAIGETTGRRRPAPYMARREMAVWAEGMRRAEKAREGRESSFYDLDYRAFLRDPLGSTVDIYDTFGLELTSDAEQAMRRWVDEHPRNRHGVHDYDPEDLGVTREEIDKHFGAYIKEHDL